MPLNSFKTAIITAAVILGGFAAVFGLSNFLEKHRPTLPPDYADQDLALQGARLKGYSLGFEGLLADWYWIQSLQYIGNKIIENPDKIISIDNLRPLNPRLLYPYLDNATTLDPRFTTAFEYGATVLPAIDSEQAIKLTEKGIANNPHEWRLYQYLGYIYWKAKNYEKAAEIYERGSHIEGVPPWMRMISAKMKSEGGSRATARSIYQQMLDETADEKIKEATALRLLELDSFDEREAVRPVLQEFQAKNERCPNDWREILPALLKIKLSSGRNLRFDKSKNLLDPTDAPYRLENKDDNCEIALNYSQSKIPE